MKYGMEQCKKTEMFRFDAHEYGWPMRVVEYRLVACMPSPENIRGSPLPPNQRVTNPLGAQTGSLCSAYAGLPPQAIDVHPRIKNHANVLEKPQHDRAILAVASTQPCIIC
jgi:hypothetical protein